MPLHSTLFSSRECRGGIIFPNNSVGGGSGRGRRMEEQKETRKEWGAADCPGHVGLKSLEAHLTVQHSMQMFAVLSWERQMLSCSIILDIDPLNPKTHKTLPHWVWHSHFFKWSCNKAATAAFPLRTFFTEYGEFTLFTHHMLLRGHQTCRCISADKDWNKAKFHLYLMSKTAKLMWFNFFINA